MTMSSDALTDMLCVAQGCQGILTLEKSAKCAPLVTVLTPRVSLPLAKRAES